MKKSGKLAGASILSAIAASLCCITPVLALISGTSGVASTFSWMEPFRPYLMGITVLVLVFAWYQKLKPRTKEEVQCDCEKDNKKPFMQTKTFLGIVTVFAFIMMAFPYYGHIFYPENQKQNKIVEKQNTQKVTFVISGMTCTSCAAHINHEVNSLNGIKSAIVSFEKQNAIIELDTTKTSILVLENAINKTGYTITSKK